MTATRRAGVIRPGTPFLDEAGRVVQLHGVGVQRVGDRWLAWGEDKSAGGTFSGIACYASPDLATWTSLGTALAPGAGDIGLDRVVERPKVLRRPDGAWVMVLHVDTADYAAARVGFAISDRPDGPYEYVGSERPLGNISRDIGVFQEGRVGYLLSEDRDHGLRIYRLRDDYLGVEEVVVTLRQQDRPELGYESPALARHAGRYFLFGSDLTGWSLNDNKYCTATNLAGPWSPWRDLAPVGSHTFESQVSTVVEVPGGFVYVGDRWLRENLHDSPAVWLPLILDADCATLVWRDAWSLGDLPLANRETRPAPEVAP